VYPALARVLPSVVVYLIPTRLGHADYNMGWSVLPPPGSRHTYRLGNDDPEESPPLPQIRNPSRSAGRLYDGLMVSAPQYAVRLPGTSPHQPCGEARGPGSRAQSSASPANRSGVTPERWRSREPTIAIRVIKVHSRRESSIR
jgi:hypothetical protein